MQIEKKICTTNIFVPELFVMEIAEQDMQHWSILKVRFSPGPISFLDNRWKNPLHNRERSLHSDKSPLHDCHPWSGQRTAADTSSENPHLTPDPNGWVRKSHPFTKSRSPLKNF
ncbi:MAG: hypothetical protein Q7V05_01445 [Methanoregula sp.]|nr:hypothetical protein [Methanoregula sp.]